MSEVSKTQVDAVVTDLVKAIRTLLPNHTVIIRSNERVKKVVDTAPLTTKVISDAQKDAAHRIQKRTSTTGITRQRKFSWKHANIDRDVLKLVERGGRHVFLAGMLSDEKAQSFHSAICNVARKLIPDNPDGTKRWRTERNRNSATITLLVRRPA